MVLPLRLQLRLPIGQPDWRVIARVYHAIRPRLCTHACVAIATKKRTSTATYAYRLARTYCATCIALHGFDDATLDAWRHTRCSLFHACLANTNLKTLKCSCMHVWRDGFYQGIIGKPSGAILSSSESLRFAASLARALGLYGQVECAGPGRPW
jgi:hypothetical protein